MTAERHEPRASAVGHEERDITFWPIVIAGGGLLLITLVVFVAMRVLFVFYDVRAERLSPPPNPLAAEYGPVRPPEPRLQAEPIRDLKQLRAAEDTILGSYGWVDVRGGVVRIPIDRAMELLVESPPPSRPARESDR